MWYPFWLRLLLNFDALGAVVVFVTTPLALSGLVSAGWAGFCAFLVLRDSHFPCYADHFRDGIHDIGILEVSTLDCPRA
jgi:hypothetical protein